MGIKGDCTHYLFKCPHIPKPTYPKWLVHPSLKTALDSLEAYNSWVEEVVMSIAFAWIEEHKADVYKHVPKKYRDDEGVAIAAAFELVRQTETYEKGRRFGQELCKKMGEGPVDTSKFNPLWTEISEHIQEEIRETFARHKRLLKHTITD
jgi:hypothetical protein